MRRSTITPVFKKGLRSDPTGELYSWTSVRPFDKVTHGLLLLKLRYYGINGPLINWMTSFLTNHTTQQVVCDGSISKLANVDIGVPQGLVLGPLFFLVFINDLPNGVSSSCHLFADDCLLYRHIHTPHNADVL